MRRDELYLSDILESADAIASFLSGGSRDSFLQSDLLRSAVLHKLTIIGEAAGRLSVDFRNRHPDIEWSGIAGFRNIAIHAYFAVDWSIVWVAATEETPQLRQQIVYILTSEYGH